MNSKKFVFVSDKDVIERLRSKSTSEELRYNTLAVEGSFFGGKGLLVWEEWLTSKGEGNEYETGTPDVSYDELCDYSAEFEEKYGKCDALPESSEYMDYHFRLVQYCIDRAHGNL